MPVLDMSREWNSHFAISYGVIWASQVALVVKNPTTSVRDLRDVVRSLVQDDPLEEDMAIHFSVLAWRNPWTEEPGGLQSIVPQSQA